ncbi:sestrin [Desulfovibrio sp. OttesenSCG-928-F20]|nr:sestrin [Desulfovibrio sp. OttesenSCG-928-F20]
MQTISLITVQDLGFEPHAYSLYPDIGQLFCRVQFRGKLGAT